MSVFGWIVVHQNVGDGFDWDLFWLDYKFGFGEISSNFWLGLERLHLLTLSQNYRLRMEVEISSGGWYSAEYWYFLVGDESSRYQLTADDYEGDAGNAMQRNGLSGKHDGMKFSTPDFDNDDDLGVHCAGNAAGGWWFDHCYDVCITCMTSHSYMNMALQTSRMMIKPW